MRHNAKFDKVFSTASWLIVFALIFSAGSQYFVTPSGLGPVARLLGSAVAPYFYATLYGIQAILLAYSKLRRRKRMRKHVLMFIYLTGFFTSFLTMSTTGLVVKLIDNLLISAVAAGCWLYWTFRTEYLDPDAFIPEINDLREDPPPTR